MFLYTIIPPEFIFDSESETGTGPTLDSVKEIEISRGRAKLQAQILPGGEYKIIRVISTDPQDYLKPEWQPGTVISFI